MYFFPFRIAAAVFMRVAAPFCNVFQFETDYNVQKLPSSCRTRGAFCAINFGVSYGMKDDARLLPR